MNPLVAGLALGAAGSVHRAAMCGPLVAAIAPVGRRAALYHAGRATVYIMLGLAAGAVGATFAIAGLGRVLAFAMAAVIAAQAVARLRGRRWDLTSSRLAKTWQSLSRFARAYAAPHPRAGAIALGMLNGLLPCGLVYAAAAVATGFGAVPAALSFMAGFALATTAVLAISVLSAQGIARRIPGLERVAPVVLIVLAALLVLRGFQVPGYGEHVH